MKFFLLIDTDDYGNIVMDHENRGVPEETVILYAETWLEFYKKRAKQPIRDSLA